MLKPPCFSPQIHLTFLFQRQPHQESGKYSSITLLYSYHKYVVKAILCYALHTLFYQVLSHCTYSSTFFSLWCSMVLKFIHADARGCSVSSLKSIVFNCVKVSQLIYPKFLDFQTVLNFANEGEVGTAAEMVSICKFTVPRRSVKAVEVVIFHISNIDKWCSEWLYQFMLLAELYMGFLFPRVLPIFSIIELLKCWQL